MAKVVIVTGASRGIGAATAMQLGKQGYCVVVNYLNDQASAKSVAEAIIAAGGNAIISRADVSSEADVKSLFVRANETFGAVTHLVNNVGVLFEKTDLAGISAERFTRVMASNVLSAFLCSREFVQQNGVGGSIVNVSSAAAKTGSPFEYLDYAASKGAMDSFTKGLSIELAAKNIRVNAVRPGFIKTDIHADGGEPNRVQRLAPEIPLRRGGEAQEVANAICWLLSDDASFVTGSFVDVAGGK